MDGAVSAAQTRPWRRESGAKSKGRGAAAGEEPPRPESAARGVQNPPGSISGRRNRCCFLLRRNAVPVLQAGLWYCKGCRDGKSRGWSRICTFGTQTGHPQRWGQRSAPAQTPQRTRLRSW